MKYVREILWIIAFTILGDVMTRLLKLPVPAGVYGLFLMLLALLSGIIRLEDVEGAGNFLLAPRNPGCRFALPWAGLICPFRAYTCCGL